MTTISDLKLPVDALARLATAAGYNARGTQIDRAAAEHHLSMFLGILNRESNHLPYVTIADAEQMMLEVFGVARGTPITPAPLAVAPRPPGVCSICGRPWEHGQCTFMPYEHARMGREVVLLEH